MLQTSNEPINLGLGFDLFDLILTFHAYKTPKAYPEPRRSPCLSVFFLGYVSDQLG